jgi:L-ribulose-5-phosphate 3-epimerase
MSFTRREFIGTSTALATTGLVNAGAPRTMSAATRPTKVDISLAAWSLIRTFRNGEWKTLDLPDICRNKFDINGVEFVNQLFEVPTYKYQQQLKRNLENAGVQPVLIMIDLEGAMAHSDKAEREQAVVQHRKWVDIAHYLGCHGVRVNVGSGPKPDPDEMLRYAEESFSALCDYAADADMNVMIENHGGMSSDPKWLATLMERVQASNFGTLPDFGNFPDDIEYYDAVRQLLPYALGISVKSKMIDDKMLFSPEKMIRMVHEFGYRGFYGIESSPTATGTADDWEAVRFLQKALKTTLNLS